MALRYIAGLIETLDPVRDRDRILDLSWRWHFPREADRVLILCLLRACAVPGVARLASRGGAQADDLPGLLARVRSCGIHSSPGRRLIRRFVLEPAKRLLDQDELCYLICLFATEERRLIERHGWRNLTAHEKIASFNHWRAMGQALGLRAMPADMAAMQRFRHLYRARHLGAPNPASAALAHRLLGEAGIGASQLAILRTLLDAPTRAALGLAEPSTLTRVLVGWRLRLGARLRRMRPDPRLPAMRDRGEWPPTTSPQKYTARHPN